MTICFAGWPAGGGVIFFGARLWLGTILGRFSINYFSRLGLRIRVRVVTMHRDTWAGDTCIVSRPTQGQVIAIRIAIPQVAHHHTSALVSRYKWQYTMVVTIRYPHDTIRIAILAENFKMDQLGS